MWSITTGTDVMVRNSSICSGNSSGPMKILMNQPYGRMRSIARRSDSGVGASIFLGHLFRLRTKWRQWAGLIFGRKCLRTEGEMPLLPAAGRYELVDARQLEQRNPEVTSCKDGCGQRHGGL